MMKELDRQKYLHDQASMLESAKLAGIKKWLKICLVWVSI